MSAAGEVCSGSAVRPNTVYIVYTKQLFCMYIKTIMTSRADEQLPGRSGSDPCSRSWCNELRDGTKLVQRATRNLKRMNHSTVPR